MNSIDTFLKVKPTPFKLASGRILISVPFSNDVFFNRSVVLLTDYDKESCAGLVINQQLPFSVREAISDIRIDDFVYQGGPVTHDMAFLIHNFQNAKNAIPLIANLYLGYDDILISLIEQQAIKNLKYKFFIGYSGWAPGQLEYEVENNMWVISHADEQLILGTASNMIWETAVRNLGNEYLHWLQIPADLSDN